LEAILRRFGWFPLEISYGKLPDLIVCISDITIGLSMLPPQS